MNLCRTCIMPDTRPDVPFVDGECQACRNYKARPSIDWEERRQHLLHLLDRHQGDCIVPSSGGKDSTAQVVMLKELGAHVTAVTATTCHPTPIGKANLLNLARHADRMIEVTPNLTVRAKLNRLGQELVGDISWPEHVAIFTIPFQIAELIGTPLIFYGENPQNQYGGPQGSEEARQMTERWRAEFGGFLGLRPSDLIGQLGITARDLEDYRMPPAEALWSRLPEGMELEAHFLGQYLPWDSYANADMAIRAGMQYAKPLPSNFWEWENLDNAQTGLHDLFAYLKYGYTRGQAQISVAIRAGHVTRDDALVWLNAHPQAFPGVYAGVGISQILEAMEVDSLWLADQIGQWTNWDLFDRYRRDAAFGLPLLKHPPV